MLTSIVLTHNSESTLANCLNSLTFCDKVVLVDDSSTDSTLQVAKTFPVQVLHHALANNFANQRNWALSQVKSDWVLFVDSDEIVTPELAKEILENINTSKYVAFSVPRLDNLWGAKVSHGDLLNARFVRLAKPAFGKWLANVHEYWKITGSVKELKSPLLHFPHKSIAEFLKKLNHYSSVRAEQFVSTNKSVSLLEIVFAPLYKFFRLYILKLGFLDGIIGFIHAMLMAFYVFLVAGKSYLLNRHD